MITTTAARRTAATAARSHRECAARARDLAEILRTRAFGHPHKDVLLVFIGHLYTAAEAFDTIAPLVMDGVTITNAIPAEASMPLLMAVSRASEHPEAGISEALFAYVTAPITRRTYRTEPLPASDPSARRDVELRTRIALAEHNLTTETDPTTRYALLAILMQLHGDRLTLGATVRAD
ncbi:hypothetical protein [Streptomyces sp. NPDC001068]|uniref:hypothetical protein n=1 Tax=Streptomyces sp. NPDC001068 TaxID=3364544 RepID=UPI003675C179